MNPDKYMSKFIEDTMNLDIRKDLQSDMYFGTEGVYT